MNVMGIDIGTTSCKVAIFDLNSGSILKQETKKYNLIMLKTNHRELDPKIILNSALECIKNCCKDGFGETVSAIAVSSQGEAVVPIDSDKNILFNAIISFDTRNIEECNFIKNNLDMDYITKVTGLPLHTMFTLSKILWLKNNHKDIYEKTWKFLCFAEFIAFSLGADVATDYTLASRTMLFNVLEKKWDEKIFNDSKIDINKFAPLKKSGTPIGKVSEEIANLTGLNKNAIISTGGHDQVCCAFGTGIFEDGVAVNSMGTTDSVLSVSPKFVFGKQQNDFKITCGSYAVDQLYANNSFLLTGGGLLQWFFETFNNENLGFDELNNKIAMNNCPSDIFVLPYFSGSGTPYLDANAKGSILGLTIETKPWEIYKAILECINFEVKLNIDNLEKLDHHITKIKCIGGGSKSDVYLQIKADVLQKKIVKLRVKEAGCLGAAIMAAMSIDSKLDLKKVIDRFIKEEKVFEPNAKSAELYLKKFEKYKNIYPNLIFMKM